MSKRAGGKLEKDERKAEILSRAALAFKDKAFDEIRMADLAADLGLAKGTLYLYFPTKESLFLALLDDRLQQAFEGLFQGLANASGPLTIDAMAQGTAAMMGGDPALPRLLAVMQPVLEKKVPYAEAIAFKRRLAVSIEAAGDALVAAFPTLLPKDARRFFLHLYAQVVGLVNLSDLSPFMRRLSAENGLELYKMGFEEGLREWCRLTLAGMLDEAGLSGRTIGEG